MQKPVPKPTAETLPLWEASRSCSLVYQRCDDCTKAQFPPSAHCTHCGSAKIGWHTSAGSGTVHSFTVVHRGPTQAFKADVPYVLGLIDLEEGFRMMMNIRSPDIATIKIGDAIRVVFEATEGGWALPQAASL